MNVGGPPSADPSSQPAADSQTSPAEGNSMLGKTHCGLNLLSAWLRNKRVCSKMHQSKFIPENMIIDAETLNQRNDSFWRPAFFVSIGSLYF